MASSGFTGDPHGTLDYWKKSDPYDAPELQKRMTAKIKKVSENGNERYISFHINIRSAFLSLHIDKKQHEYYNR